MAVELAVVLPVIIVVMVIAIDCLSFVGQCGRFDNLAAQHVLALAVSPGSESYGVSERAADVASALEADFPSSVHTVSVTADEGASTGAVTFTCTLSTVPWPLSAGSGSLLGMEIPASLDHDFAICVDCYTPGDL